MGAKGMLVAMVAGSALILWLGARRAEPAREKPVPVRPHEKPWLTHDAAAQVVGADGNLGPLFAGIEIGGPAPAPEVRARVAAFARANDVEIDLEVVDGELAAVRFDVTYGGCCGYEGADTLALKLGRPHTGSCCVCGAPDTWIDDWSVASADGVHVRARVRVNRVTVRWERTVSLPDLLERADALLGQGIWKAREAAGDHWIELEAGHRYLVDAAYPFKRVGESYSLSPKHDRENLGVQVVAEDDRISQVSIGLNELDDDTMKDVRAALRKRFGAPRTKQEGTWTWRTSTRTITAEADSYPPRITIEKR